LQFVLFAFSELPSVASNSNYAKCALLFSVSSVTGWLIKSSCLAPALGVTKITINERYDFGSGWKPTYLTSVFSLWTSVLSPPDGTTLTALADVNTDVAGCSIGLFPPIPILVTLCWAA
jgi:hypothetical protein